MLYELIAVVCYYSLFVKYGVILTVCVLQVRPGSLNEVREYVLPVHLTRRHNSIERSYQ